MLDNLILFFGQFPHWLATMLMATMPLGDLRLAIPVAILGYHMPIWHVLLLAIVGNAVPTMIILYFAGHFHQWVEKNAGFWGKHWINYLAKIQRNFEKHKKYGLWGLFVFIACSLPGTGSHPAAIIAFVFGVPFKQSWGYVFGGIVVSAIVTTMITVGVDKIF